MSVTDRAGLKDVLILDNVALSAIVSPQLMQHCLVSSYNNFPDRTYYNYRAVYGDPFQLLCKKPFSITSEIVVVLLLNLKLIVAGENPIYL